MEKVLPVRTASQIHPDPTAQTSTKLSTFEHSSPQPLSEPQSDRIVVGIDFGTTYSGVATVYSATPDDTGIIKTWPGGNGITSDKVPSEISYEGAPPNPTPKPDSSHGPSTNGSDKDKSVPLVTDDYFKSIKWGFQLRPEASRLRCMKLFLDRNQRLPSYVSPVDTADHLRKHERNVMDAVSDYLSHLHRHTIDTLTKRYGESFMNHTPIEFVLTVPAVWSDQAKNATLVAAERAGMGQRSKLRLISEPEAAAVYTLQSLQPAQMSVGDNYVVCDAGGGTVDLIAYELTSLSPMTVEESAVGTGALCGSAFLNYRFEDHVRSRIGAEKFDHMRLKKPKTWQMGMKHFEEFVKRNFTDEDTQEVNIPLPGLPDDEEAGLDSGFLTMSPKQIKDIFDPIVDKVIDLVAGQVDSIQQAGGNVAGLILVGGFGQSNYLYTRLKQHFASSSQSKESRPIEVMQPMHAWTAVVRGAVLRGLEGTIVSTRRSRFSYGTSYATVYDGSKHPVADRYWSPLWERWMVANRMQWHLHKGGQVSNATPISFHYTRNFRVGSSLVVEDELIACDYDYAPSSLSDDMFQVCTLKTDLGIVPKTEFVKMTTTKGIEFENLDFTLDMVIDSAELIFELKVGGKSYGRVTAEFH